MYCVIVLHVLFFFKQKTAYELRISDWSSDVCSSDLAAWARRGWMSCAGTCRCGRATRCTARPASRANARARPSPRSEEHTSELQSLMRISYAVFCLKKKHKQHNKPKLTHTLQQQ